MAEERMAAVDVACKAREAEFDFLREAVRRFVHELMEEEVTAVVVGLVGAHQLEEPFESASRANQAAALERVSRSSRRRRFSRRSLTNSSRS